MPDWIEKARFKVAWAYNSMWERVHRPYRRARFRLRTALGLINEHHRVTVIGLWCNEDGCYGSPGVNGIPDLTLTYFVECDWCAATIGESSDPAEAIRIAYEHSPYVDRGLFHRSRLHAEQAVRRRQHAGPRDGRFTTFGQIVVDGRIVDAPSPRDDA